MENKLVTDAPYVAFVDLKIDIDGSGTKYARSAMHLLKKGKSPFIWIFDDKSKNENNVEELIENIATGADKNSRTFSITESSYTFLFTIFKEEDPVKELKDALKKLGKNPKPNEIQKVIDDYVLVKKLDEVI